MKKHIIFPLIAAISLMITGCGKKDSDDGGTVGKADITTSAETGSEASTELDTYEPLGTVRERDGADCLGFLINYEEAALLGEPAD